MKKYLLIAFIAIGGVLAVCGINRYLHGRPLHVESKSPSKKYFVKLDADDAPYPNPLIFFPNDYRNRIVRATILTSNQTYLSDFIIYKGDAFDSSFKDLYPDHEWLSESIFYIGDINEQDLPNQKDQIIISNQSDESLSYLLLSAGRNDFFILDLPAGSTTKIPVFLDRSERFIGCEGKFIGGKSLNFQQVYFSTLEEQESPINYCLKVKNSSVLIQSPELDGKILNNHGDLPVPKGDCGL